MKIMTYNGSGKLEVSEIEDFPMNNGSIRIKTLYFGISHGTEMNAYRGFAPFFRRKSNNDIRLFTIASEKDKWEYPIRSCDPKEFIDNDGVPIRINGNENRYEAGTYTFLTKFDDKRIFY